MSLICIWYEQAYKFFTQQFFFPRKVKTCFFLFSWFFKRINSRRIKIEHHLEVVDVLNTKPSFCRELGRLIIGSWKESANTHFYFSFKEETWHRKMESLFMFSIDKRCLRKFYIASNKLWQRREISNVTFFLDRSENLATNSHTLDRTMVQITWS